MYTTHKPTRSIQIRYFDSKKNEDNNNKVVKAEIAMLSRTHFLEKKNLIKIEKANG